MFGLFKKAKVVPAINHLTSIDMHSHILPGIDDGAQNVEESIELIKGLSQLGYKKFWCTPHIMGDYFRNNRQIIEEKRDIVRNKLEEHGLGHIQIEAAAEYYLDEFIFEDIKSGKDLMPLKDKFLLVETSYINECSFLQEARFEIKKRGYETIIAHPERYEYVQDISVYKKWKQQGFYLQLNLNSLTGYYSKSAKIKANELLKEGLVDFIGTDCHKLRHTEVLKDLLSKESFRNIPLVNVKNNLL